MTQRFLVGSLIAATVTVGAFTQLAITHADPNDPNSGGYYRNGYEQCLQDAGANASRVEQSCCSNNGGAWVSEPEPAGPNSGPPPGSAPAGYCTDPNSLLTPQRNAPPSPTTGPGPGRPLPPVAPLPPAGV